MTTAFSKKSGQGITDGTIAVANLHAQIAGLAARARRAGSGQAPAWLAVAKQAVLVDLLALRGEVLGCIADYERAAELAERLVRDAPDDATARLARPGRARPSTVSPRHWPTLRPQGETVWTEGLYPGLNPMTRHFVVTHRNAA